MVNIIRFIIMVAVIFVIGELLVRTTIASPEASISDDQLGWVYKPHSKIFHTTEGWASNTVNSMGFNDREISTGQYEHHILVLGDSYTEALQIQQSKNFTSIVEEELTCADVINGGRSGLSPIQYPIVVERFLDKLPISTIVMVISAGDMSDIKENKAVIVRDASTGSISNIELKERKLHWFREKTSFVYNYSALATYFKNRTKALLLEKDVPSKVPSPNLKKEIEGNKDIQDILTYIFKRINSKVPLSVLYIPSLEYNPEGKVSFKKESEKFENLVEELAKYNKIPFISAKKFMVESYQYNHRPPVGFSNSNILSGHLNETGHRSVAAALFKLISLQCIVSRQSNNMGTGI